jgi:hypothetical protein
MQGRPKIGDGRQQDRDDGDFAGGNMESDRGHYRHGRRLRDVAFAGVTSRYWFEEPVWLLGRFVRKLYAGVPARVH